MKQRQGFQVAGLIIGIIVVALLGFATFMVIDGNNKAVDYNKYDFYSIIEPSKDNGNIGDHVKGSPDAPVVIFEYADFQCPGCASINPKVNKAIEELDGKLAVVYRNHLLSYHKNGTAAASAAEAASLQSDSDGKSYWKPYTDKLFAEQAEWEYATGSERTALFEKYFTEVTDGQGDLDKFRTDVAGADVSQKISFDMGIGRHIDIEATPAFFVDGQLIKWSDAGELTFSNGETVTWDSSQGGDNFVKLLKRIVEAKTK
ncbi:thioredoxin domain-containing protein [Candidatus Saccharibacteria bacterium]|nr:thioredoxin domain-containing protein [Candidatus Saccharibacteria bacterium]